MILPLHIVFTYFVSHVAVNYVHCDVSNAVQNLYCDPGLKNNNWCPVDGGWTSWSPWQICSGKCGFKGRRTRHRTCNNPLPSNNGAPCFGPSYQSQTCQIIGCTMNNYEDVVHDHPIRKGELEVVKEIHKMLPALIELCFSVDCTYSTVNKILGNNTMLYWNAMNCLKYGVGCPIPGGWSKWDSWSQCTAFCGKGKQFRTRMCNSPLPSDPKLMCKDLAFETKNCIGFNCKKHSKESWSNWSKWSSCSVQCGNGVRIRKRSCSESQNSQDSSCKGPVKEIKGCMINNCSINGMWSPWTAWTSCSSSCGIGTQLRNRMCNNPSPKGTGISCYGSASEIRQCFTKPCIVKSHEVAHFTEKSSLLYTTNGKFSRLLHLYLRFLPQTPFGILIYRFEDNCKGSTCDFVKLSLQNGKVVFLSQISGCTLGLVHEEKLEIGQWHVILAALCGTYGVLRIDNGFHKVGPFSCVPISYNLDHEMRVGEGFEGQIQELAVNFELTELQIPKDEHNQKRRNVPISSNNIQYLMGDDEEGYIYIDLTESVSVPSPKNMKFWQITIIVKPEDINGVLAFIPDSSLNKYILLLLEEGKVKLKFYQGTTHVASESTEHILVGEWFEVTVTQDDKNLYMQLNGNEKKYVPLILENTMINSEIGVFIGAIRDEIKEKMCPKCAEIAQMSFTLGYLDIDENEIDLLSLPVLDTTSEHYSSRTISLSDYYEEIPLLLGQEFKLSCFYDQRFREVSTQITSKKSHVTWLLFDKFLNSYGKSADLFDLKDDGRVSTISASSYPMRNAIENFYSCFIHYYRNNLFKGSKNALFTFGIAIIDRNEEYENIFWKEWSFIYSATILCFIFMIVWCLFEICQDTQNGHSFYGISCMLNGDTASVINYVLSKEGVTLLGSQQAANEIVTNITEDN